MTRRRHLLSRSRGAAVAAAAALVAGLLTGCGGPPGSRTDPFGPAPTTSSAPTTAPADSSSPANRSFADATASPRPSAQSSSGPSTPARTPSRPAEIGPWTGTFHGHTVKIPRGHGAQVSFTFDDGPSPKYTPQVLALLESNDVPAVFCLIGQQARAYPALVRKEANAGHLLCDHSRDHDLAMNRKGQAYVTREVTDGLAAIHAAAPQTPVPFYRQPGGTWSPLVVHAMHGSDLTPLRWTDDPRDWSRPGSQAIVHRVVTQLAAGGVVLMHDGGGDRSQTVEALTWLLPALKAAGWVPVTAPKHMYSNKAAARPQ